jgi:hypothetical protein
VLLSLLAFAPDAEAARSGPSCPRLFSRLSSIELEARISGAWSRYNRGLSSVIGELGDAQAIAAANDKFREFTSDYAKLHPEFPKGDFEAFMTREWSSGRLPNPSARWGEVLEQGYSAFLRQFERDAEVLRSRATELVDEGRTLVAKCGKDSNCIAELTEPRSLLARVRGRLADTCLAKSPSAVTGLAQEIGMTWSVLGGFFLLATERKADQFAWAFAVNSTIWSWFLYERHCGNAIAAAQKLPFGKTVAQLPRNGWGSRLKSSVREELADWVWIPAMATTSIGLSMYIDSMFGKERPENFYEWRWSYLVLYNAAAGPVRRVLVLDPVFKSAFPALGAWAEKMISSGRLAQTATKTTELGVDYGLRWAEFELWFELYRGYMEGVGGVSTK